MTTFMKGESMLAKLAALAKYGVFPGVMLASLIYSPPDYALPNKKADLGSSSSSQ